MSLGKKFVVRISVITEIFDHFPPDRNTSTAFYVRAAFSNPWLDGSVGMKDVLCSSSGIFAKWGNSNSTKATAFNLEGKICTVDLWLDRPVVEQVLLSQIRQDLWKDDRFTLPLSASGLSLKAKELQSYHLHGIQNTRRMTRNGLKSQTTRRSKRSRSSTLIVQRQEVYQDVGLSISDESSDSQTSDQTYDPDHSVVMYRFTAPNKRIRISIA